MAIYFLHAQNPNPSVLEMIPSHFEHNGIVKIGYTKRPLYKRIDEIKHEVKYKIGYIELMGAVFGDRQLEWIWHHTNQTLRLKSLGEWFILTDTLKHDIKTSIKHSEYDRVRDKVSRSIARTIQHDDEIYKKLYAIAEYMYDHRDRKYDQLVRAGEDDYSVGKYFSDAFKLAIDFTYDAMHQSKEEEGT